MKKRLTTLIALALGVSCSQVLSEVRIVEASKNTNASGNNTPGSCFFSDSTSFTTTEQQGITFVIRIGGFFFPWSAETETSYDVKLDGVVVTEADIGGGSDGAGRFHAGGQIVAVVSDVPAGTHTLEVCVSESETANLSWGANTELGGLAGLYWTTDVVGILGSDSLSSFDVSVIEDLEMRIAVIEALDYSQFITQAELQAAIDGLQLTIDQLIARNDGQDAAIVSLQTDVANLTAAQASLQSEVDALTASTTEGLAAVNTALDELATQVAANTAAAEDIETLRAEIASISAKSGANGSNGSDGATVTGVKTNSDGTLTFTYSDGSKVKTSKSVGGTGSGAANGVRVDEDGNIVVMDEDGTEKVVESGEDGEDASLLIPALVGIGSGVGVPALMGLNKDDGEVVEDGTYEITASDGTTYQYSTSDGSTTKDTGLNSAYKSKPLFGN